MASSIDTVVVAGCGESANRVLRTLRRMGLRTVLVHSETDPTVYEDADERLALDGIRASDDWSVQHLVAVAQDTGADAIHPGYGVLREGPAVARACTAAGLIYIGPPLAAIEALATRVDARRSASLGGLRVIEGSNVIASYHEAQVEADRLGYPVLIKPVAGGAGVGLHKVCDAAELRSAFDLAAQEAATLCCDERLYLERWIDGARPIEVQVASERRGRAVHFGVRATTAGHRYRRLFEESPPPDLASDVRERAQNEALALARHVGLAALGTVEFLVSGDQVFFLGMSTRLQVEHSLSEVLAGVDLVEWQVRLALGEALPARQNNVALAGHAIQCRLYADAPPNERFLAGRVRRLETPVGEGVRNDLGLAAGAWVSAREAPLVAKLIVHGEDRGQALVRLRAALAQYVVEGVPTNLPLLRRIAADPLFEAGAMDDAHIAVLASP